jgi:hypothetical protein
MLGIASQQLRANQQAESRVAQSLAFQQEWQKIFGDKPIPLSVGYQFGAYGNNVNNTGTTFFANQQFGARQYTSSKPLDEALVLQQLYRLAESITKTSAKTTEDFKQLSSQVFEERHRLQEIEAKAIASVRVLKAAESTYRASLQKVTIEKTAKLDLNAAVVSIFKTFCIKCHTPGSTSKGSKYPLDTRLDAIGEFTSIERWKIVALTSTAKMPEDDPLKPVDVGILFEWAEQGDIKPTIQPAVQPIQP